MTFETCNHARKFHIDADKSGGPGNKPWQSFFICELCNKVITFQEKCGLDQVQIALNQLNATKDSLRILNLQSKIAMRANIIATITLIIAFLVFLFGDNVAMGT